MLSSHNSRFGAEARQWTYPNRFMSVVCGCVRQIREKHINLCYFLYTRSDCCSPPSTRTGTAGKPRELFLLVSYWRWGLFLKLLRRNTSCLIYVLWKTASLTYTVYCFTSIRYSYIWIPIYFPLTYFNSTWDPGISAPFPQGSTTNEHPPGFFSTWGWVLSHCSTPCLGWYWREESFSATNAHSSTASRPPTVSKSIVTLYCYICAGAHMQK